MFDTLLADGLVSGASEKVAAFLIKCLAVAGGFVIGYFLGGVIGWALDRWVFAQKAPAPLKKAVSIAAGIAVAILVALFVFGEGGGGLFGRGGGPGDKQGTEKEGDKGKQPQTPPVEKKDDVKPPKPKDKDPVPPPKPADVVVAVTVLGGADVPNNDEKYYLVEGDTNRKDIKEVEAVVADRKAKANGSSVGIAISFRATNRPPLNPEAESITLLRDLARRHNVAITFPPQP